MRAKSSDVCFRYWIPVFGGVIIMLAVFIYMIWHAKRSMTLYQVPKNPAAVAQKV